MHYEYPRERDALPYAYDELLGSLSWRDRAALNVSYSPNTSRFTFDAIAVHRPAWSLEGVWRQPLNPRWSIATGAGPLCHERADRRGLLVLGNVSLIGRRDPWRLELSAIGTDNRARQLFGDPIAGQRWVISLIKRIPGTP